jgi:hypothetical protein
MVSRIMATIHPFPMKSPDPALTAKELPPVAPGRVALVCFMLLAGAGLWEVYGGLVHFAPARLVALMVLAVVCLSPGIRGGLFAAMDWLSRPAPLAKLSICLLVTAAAGAYLYETEIASRVQGFGPVVHDESVYLIQAQMLAHGRLWMAKLPLPDFFHSFYLFVTPVYAGKYPPGFALLLAPMICFDLPMWLIPLLVSSCCVGAAYLLFTELGDGLSGLLAALLLMAAGEFQLLLNYLLPYVPAMLFLLLMLWAGVKWRAGQRAGWAAAVGFFSGFALLIRPAESLCFILPLGAVMLMDLWQRGSVRHAAGTIGMIFLAAAPLLAVQVASNVGITGKWYELPYARYMAIYNPAHRLGFREYHPRHRLLEQMDDIDARWAPDLVRHTPANLPAIWVSARLPLMCRSLVCAGLLLPLLPL